MLILIAIGFVAGIVTALSPCVLPVLPIVLAGGATGRRPLAIIAGIVVSFTVFTLFAAWLLDLLGLPQDVLRNLAIALLLARGAHAARAPGRRAARAPAAAADAARLGRPRRRLPARREPRPRLRPVRRAGARGGDGPRRAARVRPPTRRCSRSPTRSAPRCRCSRSRSRASAPRAAFRAERGDGAPRLGRPRRRGRARDRPRRRPELQTWLPGYTEALQERFERSEAAQRELRELTGSKRAGGAAGGGGGER